ncbi:MAG: bifunctional DNA primase/polymerase [Alphaproteobacteria bacterium]|nr:bifunctional DNA primase/polymerase [Alphaproteobacteria bacterium]
MQVTDVRAYLDIAAPWLRLGYPAIPCELWHTDKYKAPVSSFKPFIGADRRKPTRKEMADWLRMPGARNALLLLGDPMPGAGVPHLHALDEDDPAVHDWIVQTFGETPLTQSTGRIGGGMHHLYRSPPGVDIYRSGIPKLSNGVLGPDAPRRATDGASPIDLRICHSYIIAAGSVHRTQVPYRLHWQGRPIGVEDLTPEMLWSLPVLDYAVLRTELDTGKERRRRARGAAPARTASTGPAHRVSRGGYDQVDADPTKAVFPTGPWAGRAVASVIEGGLAPGEYETGCPHHDSVSERSATFRVRAGGEVSLSCHSGCRATYHYVVSADAISPADVDAVLDTLLGDLAHDVPEVVEAPVLPPQAVDGHPADELDEADARARRLLWRLHGPAAMTAAVPVGSLLDGLDLGENVTIAGNVTGVVQGGLSREILDDPSDILDDKGASPVEPSDAEIDAAIKAHAALGGGPAWCPRGPYLHAARRGSSTACSTQLPCGSYDCSTCGPRKLTAWEAAAGTVLRRFLDGAWEGYTFEVVGGIPVALRQALRRWRKAGNGTYVATSPAPDRTVVTLMFPRSGRPTRGLHGLMIEHGATCLDSADEVIRAVCGSIRSTDRMAWVEHDGDARLIASKTTITRRITALRDLVLGRGSVSKQEDVVSHVSYTPTATVIDIAENMMGHDVDVIDEVVVARKGAKRTIWAFDDRRITPDVAIERIKRDGEEAHVRVFTPPPDGGYVDLDIGVPVPTRRTA